MAFTMNICPKCEHVFHEDRMDCPKCGHEEEWFWWDKQNIELYIAIQGASSLSEAGDLKVKRLTTSKITGK